MSTRITPVPVSPAAERPVEWRPLGEALQSVLGQVARQVRASVKA